MEARIKQVYRNFKTRNYAVGKFCTVANVNEKYLKTFYIET